jgi:hypothetical protein
MAICAKYSCERYFKLPSWMSPDDVTYNPDSPEKCITKYMAYIRYDELVIYETSSPKVVVYRNDNPTEMCGFDDYKYPDDAEVISKEDSEDVFEDEDEDEDVDEDEDEDEDE